MHRRERAHGFWPWVVALFVLAVLLPGSVGAQGEPIPLLLRLRRDWGYGGAGQIQGNFSLLLSGPTSLERVTFLLDERAVAEVAAPPWTWKFHTSQFSPGSHVLQAVGLLKDGTELRSNEVRVQFLSDVEAAGSTVRIVVILLAVCVGLLALAGMATLWLASGRRNEAEAGGRRARYGLLGGAVCPKCGRPFRRHWWAPSMGWFGRLDRCPHCAQWSRVKRASERELSTALGLGAKEVAPDVAETMTEGERLRRELDESRYVDL